MKKMVISIFILFIFFINLCKTNNNVSFNCVEYCLEDNVIDIQISYEEKKELCKEECINDCLPLCISYFKKNYNPYKTKTDLQICQEICY